MLTRRETLVRYHAHRWVEHPDGVTSPVGEQHPEPLRLARTNTASDAHSGSKQWATLVSAPISTACSLADALHRPFNMVSTASSGHAAGCWPNRSVTASAATDGTTRRFLESTNCMPRAVAAARPVAAGLAGTTGAQAGGGTLASGSRPSGYATPCAGLVPTQHGCCDADGAIASGVGVYLARAASHLDGKAVAVSAAASAAAVGSSSFGSRSSTSCATCQRPARALRPHHSMHAGTVSSREQKGVRSVVTTHQSFKERGDSQELQGRVQSLQHACACQQTSQLPASSPLPVETGSSKLLPVVVHSKHRFHGSVQAGMESRAAAVAVAKLSRHRSEVVTRKGEGCKDAHQSALEVVCPRGWLDGSSELQSPPVIGNRDKGDGSVMRMQMKQWFSGATRNSLQAESHLLLTPPDSQSADTQVDDLYPDDGLSAAEPQDGIHPLHTTLSGPSQ